MLANYYCQIQQTCNEGSLVFFTEIKQIIIAIEQTRIGANHICTHISNALLGLYVTWSSPVFIYISSHECLSTRFEVTQYTGHLQTHL